MIRSLNLKCFRKHEDTHIDFTAGLNVLRGPNEAGKTTVTEGLLYALYGSGALVDTLAQVVTWGHKENELSVKLVIRIGDVDYTFTRSKAGAECTYAGVDGVTVRVTGQKEVTNFAATLLGADARTAGVLMLSSQAGLRGALDEGAAAVGALMGKLANFDLIDKVLDTANQRLLLGSIVPFQTKITEAEAEKVLAERSVPTPVVDIDTRIDAATVAVKASEDALEKCLDVVTKADAAVEGARQSVLAKERATNLVVETQGKLDRERSRYDYAATEAASLPDPEALAALRAQVLDAEGHATRVAAYAAFLDLPAYPAVAWDDTKESFDTVFDQVSALVSTRSGSVNSLDNDVKVLNSKLITSGKCPTCGHAAMTDEHVAAMNAETQSAIDKLIRDRVALVTALVEAQGELKVMKGVVAAAERRRDPIMRLHQYLVYDTSVYPQKVTWKGDAPDGDSNITVLRGRLRDAEAAHAGATQAAGRAAAYKVAVAELEAALVQSTSRLAEHPEVDVSQFKVAYEVAYSAYTLQSTQIQSARESLREMVQIKADYDRAVSEAASRIERAQARIDECKADVKKLEFNNELVRKLKSFKPQITDYLWNSVLAAVGNFFSTLRGEQSVVTKDSTGFRVNGRGGSLSGSTLDVLALSIRVALTKTFLPHVPFIVLDEPAHGCDEVRTGNLLGFLSSVGFQQTLLASHDELSEAVADNVILLGAAT